MVEVSSDVGGNRDVKFVGPLSRQIRCKLYDNGLWSRSILVTLCGLQVIAWLFRKVVIKMGNKIVTFTEEQLEDYQVMGCWISSVTPWPFDHMSDCIMRGR